MEEADKVIQARSDVNRFKSIGEALDEALIRADGASVFIHSTDDSQQHNLESGEHCFCNPTRLESRKLK